MNAEKTLPQQTADRIIEYIVSNGLKPGNKIPTEKDLISIMCVSRSVLREALCILTTMHVLETVQGSGIYISPPENAAMLNSYQAYLKLGYASINDMYEIWIRLESTAAEYAAERADKEIIHRLNACNQEFKLAINNEQVFKEIDERFHSVIAESTGNTLLIMNLRSLSEIISEYRHLTLQYVDIRMDAYKFHLQIFNAIAEHNPELAKRLMNDHLTRVKQSADYYQLFMKPEK